MVSNIFFISDKVLFTDLNYKNHLLFFELHIQKQIEIV